MITLPFPCRFFLQGFLLIPEVVWSLAGIVFLIGVFFEGAGLVFGPFLYF